MNLRFLSDGDRRIHPNEEVQSRLQKLKETIAARHAAEWTNAGCLRRCLILWRIHKEFQRESLKIRPSRQTLYYSSAHWGVDSRDSL